MLAQTNQLSMLESLRKDHKIMTLVSFTLHSFATVSSLSKS